ncbi:MAG: retention module-containing protein, partial [Formivibrio sp.]|nr:retention module-containing protein [Formivibrio sp.]
MAELNVNSAKSHQTVVVLEGTAYLRDPAGRLTPIKPGDQLAEGQVLVTDAHGHVRVLLPSGDSIEIGPDRELKVDAELVSTTPADHTDAAITGVDVVSDRILSALQSGTDLSTELDPTAAGLNAGAASDGGHGFVRLTRVVEGIDPLAFDFQSSSAGGAEGHQPGDTSAQAVLVHSLDTTVLALTAQLDPASDSGTKGDHITNDNTPTISGTGEPGATIDVTIPGTNEHLTTTVGTNGTWSITPTQAIPDGPVTIPVIETDKVGNLTSANVPVIVDTSASASVTINTIAGDDVINAAEAGSNITLSGTVGGDVHAG